MRKKFLALAAALLLNFAPVSAEKAWTLPEHGLYLESGSKQSYLAEKIDRYFNTKPNAIKFEAPDGWNFETFDVDGVAVECLENPGAGTSRVVFQLHGGGYVLPLSDVYRNFAVKQAVLSDAAKTYMIDYRLAPDNIYHAWNMFYTEESGWTTAEFEVDPRTWNRIDMTFLANGADSQFIGDASNYTDVYQY